MRWGRWGFRQAIPLKNHLTSGCDLTSFVERREMAARYVFRDEYEPVFGRATDKNSSIDDTGEEKQHI